MKYFRAKKIVTELTTLLIRPIDQEKLLNYHSEDEYEYYGVETEDLDSLLAAQLPELEAQELSYQEIKPILDNCRMMIDFNSIIESQIAERYSFGRELKMRDLLPTDPERIEYEA
ncbi:MAG: hypothetical protein Q8T08_17030, partial [Ignavibacteria bacterium]|nr:hypothetical protein [Ignavibacteria bacterium]